MIGEVKSCQIDRWVSALLQEQERNQVIDFFRAEVEENYDKFPGFHTGCCPGSTGLL
jgi:hypothetical protein